MDLPGDLSLPWNLWLVGERLGSLGRVEAAVHRASCWDLQDPCLDLDLGDLLAALEPAVVGPSWAASSGVDNHPEPFPVALGDPGAEAFPDAAAAAIVAVLHVAPFGDAVDPADAVAYAAVADRVVLLGHRGLAYGEAVVVHRVPAAGEDRSYAVAHAAEAEDRADWVAAVHAEVGDLAFACAHLVHPVAAPGVHEDAADLVLAPYAVGLVEVPAAADTDYVATGMVRGFARVAPLDSAPVAEA